MSSAQDELPPTLLSDGLPTRAQLRPLYPHVEPYDTGLLRVDGVHEIYYEQSGNPDGKPAVFLHGGPGGGSNPRQRRFWDPRHYRIVLFDQRGCGRSKPHASLERNTTWDLVHDMEALRAHLGIARWQVFGGSWGSALALAYAQAHPYAVSELVLRGVFLLRRKELAWFYQSGANRIFPDAWEHFLEPIPPEEQADLIQAYYRRLTSSDPDECLQAARAWSVWEASASTLVTDPGAIAAMTQDHFALAFARIECHYFAHGGFFERETQLLDDVSLLEHIPCTIVQGRYDVICPADSAWALHRAWPAADLRMCPRAGHSAFEPEIAHELVEATDRYR